MEVVKTSLDLCYSHGLSELRFQISFYYFA